MKNRAADGEKGTGTRKHGQSFFGGGEKLTFSTACRSLHFFNAPAWTIPLEHRRRDDDTQQGSCGCRIVIIKDLAAGSARNFNTEPFSDNLRNTSAILAGLYQNVFRTFFFQKNKRRKECA